MASEPALLFKGPNPPDAAAQGTLWQDTTLNSLNAHNGRWFFPLGGGVWDVRAFGAIGDGVTDDAAAVAAAVAALPTRGVLVFPPGHTYKLRSTLALPTATKRITVAAYGAILDFSGLGAGVDAITVNGNGGDIPSHFGWFGGDIRGSNTTGSGNGFVLQASGFVNQMHSIVLRDVVVQNFKGTGKAGIYLDGVFGVRIDNTWVRACDTGLLAVSSALTPDDVLVTGGAFSDATTFGVRIRIGNSIRFIGVKLTGNGSWGAALDPTGAVNLLAFENCWFESNVSGGFEAIGVAGGSQDSMGLRVKGCFFVGNDLVIASPGANHDDFEITNNLFNGGAALKIQGTNARYGVIGPNKSPSYNPSPPAGLQCTTFDTGGFHIGDNARGNWGLVAFMTQSVGYDPPSMADQAIATTTVTVTGATVGDFAVAAFNVAGGIPAGVLISASVTAANTVTVTLFNRTGGAVDLGNGTLLASVWRFGGTGA